MFRGLGGGIWRGLSRDTGSPDVPSEMKESTTLFRV